MNSIDVIVPCYEYGHFLEECVRSVLDQECVDVRVLVLDDASQDCTQDIAEALAKREPRVTYVRHRQNRGHTRTFNEGLEWATAEYTMLLSADDFLLPGALARSLALLEEHPDVGFVFGTVLYLYPDGTKKRVTPIPRRWNGDDTCVLSGSEFIERSGVFNLVPTPTVVVRTDLQKRLGGYRMELPHTGDMEMWLRFAANASVGFVVAPQGVYRRHATNMSSTFAVESMLPDVRQRRTALDCFFEGDGRRLAGSAMLRRKLQWDLGKNALALASGALNSGERRVSQDLVDLGLEICPEIKGSWSWRKLTVKREMDSCFRRISEGAVALVDGRKAKRSGEAAP